MLALAFALWAQLQSPTCFVDQIDNGTALLMRADSTTFYVKARRAWREGQFVTCPTNR